MNEEIFKKKLIYKSLKRGNKENDIILGKFAKDFVNLMPLKDLEIYAKFLEEDDDSIYNWVSRKEELPVVYKNTIIEKILI